MSAGDQIVMKAVEGNPMSEIEQLRREIALIKTMVLNVASGDSVTQNIGNVTQGELRFKDNDEKLRVIFSAINLLAEFGIPAHFAGFAEDGVTPTVWIDADYGGFTALGGNMVIDATGLNIFGLNLAQYFQASNDGVQRRAFLGMYLPQGATVPVWSILFTGPPGTNLITNGNAETGDETGWTDAQSAWTIEADPYEGTYAFKHNGSAEAFPGYLKQNVGVTAGNILTFAFVQKRTAGILAPKVKLTWKTSAPATISTDTVYGSNSNGWTTFEQSFIAPATAASVDIELIPGDPLNDEYFDNIELYVQSVSTELRLGDGELTAIVDGVTYDLLAEPSYFEASTKTVGPSSNRTTGSAYTYMEQDVFLHRGIMLNQVLWDFSAAGNYTLTIRDWEGNILSTVAVNGVGAGAVNVVFATNDLILRGGRYKFRMTKSSSAVWKDFNGTSLSYTEFDLNALRYDGTGFSFTAPIRLVFYNPLR
jgi:hypothetical protein